MAPPHLRLRQHAGPSGSSELPLAGGDLHLSGDAEADLVERAKTDTQAFAQLYEHYYARILNHIYRATFDAHVAEQLTSNTFFKMLRGLGRYNGRAPFAAWLYRIATNEIRMHWRSSRRRKTNDPAWQDQLRRIYFASHETQTPEQIEDELRQFEQLHRALAKLPHRYRAPLLLRYFEQLSQSEIAHVLGKSLGTVKSLIHRGLKRLKRQLDDGDATACPRRHL